MSKIRNLLLLLTIFLLIISCKDNAQGSDGLTTPDYTDPDPLLTDEIPVAPEAPKSLYVIANINGEIRAFNSNAPAEYIVITNDANTENYFSEISLSNDKQHLLYVNTAGDLILFNITYNDVVVLQEDVSCNETQFIDNDKIQFSHGSNIYCYTISTGLQYLMINDPVLHCNHGAVVSPDGSRIVFKNQEPGQTETAVYAWADVTGETVTSCTYLDDTENIELLELLEFIWIDNDTIFLKPSAGVNTRLKSFTIGNSIPYSANVVYDGSVVQFTNLAISNDLSKLIFYGSFGLYEVDLTALVLSNSLEVTEVYTSEVVTTKFVAYSVNSDYFVAATSGCIGVYEADSLKQTDFKSTQIIAEGDTLYSLDCK